MVTRWLLRLQTSRPCSEGKEQRANTSYDCPLAGKWTLSQKARRFPLGSYFTNLPEVPPAKPSE